LERWELGPSTPAGRRHWRATLVVATPPIAAMLYALYIVRIGGDFMRGRMLLPALFDFMLPLASVSMEIPRRQSLHSLLKWSGVGIVTIWAVTCVLLFRWPYEEADIRDGIPENIIDERRFFVEQTGSSHPISVDDYRGTTFRWVEHGLETRLTTR
jgi:arabinofuranosyltransferase